MDNLTALSSTQQGSNAVEVDEGTDLTGHGRNLPERSLGTTTQGSWAAEQSVWLGNDIAEMLQTSKVRLLDRNTVSSATSAAEGLNRGIFRCMEDMCIVYSASNKGYSLLYKAGHKEEACAAVASIRASSSSGSEEENRLDAAPVPTEGSDSGGHCHAGVCGAMMATQGDSCGDGGMLPPLVLASAGEQQDMLAQLGELTGRGEATKAEELLIQGLRSGCRPSEACFDAIILALDRDGKSARAAQWLWHTLEKGMVPSEASFNCVVLGACREGSPQTVEEAMQNMFRLRILPCKEIFNEVIRLFSARHEAQKVELWLLNAGQSGHTPGQSAFEDVVLLFAETDASKADEWLSRAQQTEYQLPDKCFCAVVQAFTHLGRVDKATDRLSRMIQEGRTPSEESLHDVVAALADAGDVTLAEAWLGQLIGGSSSSSPSLDGLRCKICDAALHTESDITCAEQQLSLLSEPDARRTQRIASRLAERGEQARALALLQRFCALGGPVTAEISAAIVAASAAQEDAAVEEGDAAEKKKTRTAPELATREEETRPEEARMAAELVAAFRQQRGSRQTLGTAGADREEAAAAATEGGTTCVPTTVEDITNTAAVPTVTPAAKAAGGKKPSTLNGSHSPSSPLAHHKAGASNSKVSRTSPRRPAVGVSGMRRTSAGVR